MIGRRRMHLKFIHSHRLLQLVQKPGFNNLFFVPTPMIKSTNQNGVIW